MKKYFCFLFAAMLCIGMAGCSVNGNDNTKDDAGNGGNNNSDKIEEGDDRKALLIGLWEAEKDWEEDYGYDYWDDGELVLRFKEDGTGFWMIEDEEDDVDSFEWEIDGTILYFYDNGEVEDYAIIEKLGVNELILSYESGKFKEYYTRIN